MKLRRAEAGFSINGQFWFGGILSSDLDESYGRKNTPRPLKCDEVVGSMGKRGLSMGPIWDDNLPNFPLVLYPQLRPFFGAMIISKLDENQSSSQLVKVYSTKN
jgi:hypothetical protein